MSRWYMRKRYHTALVWSLIAVLFITLLVPAALGISEHVNSEWGNEQRRISELSNATIGPKGVEILSLNYHNVSWTVTNEDQGLNEEINPPILWDTNETWDSVYLSVSQTTDAVEQNIMIVYNLSASDYVDMAIEELHIKMKGLVNANYGAVVVAIVTVPFKGSFTNVEIGQYEILYNQNEDGMGDINITLKIDPAKMRNIEATLGKNTTTLISIHAAADEGGVILDTTERKIDFDIYATRPKNLITGKYTLLDAGIFIVSIIVFAGAIFATGYVNPMRPRDFLFRRPLRGLKRYYNRRRRTRRPRSRSSSRRWY